MYLQDFFSQIFHVITFTKLGVLAGTLILGIMFGALPGLTATLGVALLTTVTLGRSMGGLMHLFSLIFQEPGQPLPLHWTAIRSVCGEGAEKRSAQRP